MGIYLLTIGQYDDYSVLGVFEGTKSEAQAVADRMTVERADRYISRDMIKVTVEETEKLS